MLRGKRLAPWTKALAVGRGGVTAVVKNTVINQFRALNLVERVTDAS